MEKLTKQDLKGPDIFISNMSRFSELLYDFRAPIMSLLGVAVAVGIGWVVYSYFDDKKETKAQEALFQVQKKLKTIEEDFKKSEAPPPPTLPGQKAPPAPPPSGVKRSGDMATDYKDIPATLQDIVRTYSGTQASVIAALDLSKIYYDHKKYDEEIPLLEAAVKAAKHPVTKGISLDALAMAYEAKGDCQKAVGQWQEIEKEKGMTFLLGNSLVKMGLCYEKIGAKDKAEQAYLKAEGLTQDQTASKTAKKYLRLLRGQS